MSKLKTFLTLFIMAAVVIACTFLPNIVNAIQSHNSDAAYKYADMQTAQLRIEDKAPLTTLGKLVLLADSTSVEIPEDQANMTIAEVHDAAYRCLDVFSYADLITVDYHYFMIEAVPGILYSNQSPVEYSTIWSISLSAPDYTSVIDLIIDDETGALLHISYETSAGLLSEYDLPELLPFIAELYFSPLSLQPSAENFGESIENPDTDAYWFSGTYIFYDDIYNEVVIEISLSPHGFSTHFIKP